ncbi:unnamed protein product [Owenia fusiformis]|uniref:Microtubule-associated protein futsch n=1 Tax=Owenia fusiformis TaxID=6347 RepID=A0A8S4PQH9_OWEFU|nr:unnamed protein product [Owenia fusiformis]
MSATRSTVLVIVGEILSPQHKDLVLEQLTKGFKSWDVAATGCAINEELNNLVAENPKGEQGACGETVIHYEGATATFDILINPPIAVVKQTLKAVLAIPSNHRHIVFAGHAFTGTGAWILQDDVFKYEDFVQATKDGQVQNNVKQNGGSMTIQAFKEGNWNTEHFAKTEIGKSLKVTVNAGETLTDLSGVLQLTAFIGDSLNPLEAQELLKSSQVVGNIRFSRPTLYIFPGAEGDSSMFGISGFNLLIDGGYSKKSSFWDFTRHIDRVDAILMTHIGADNLFGISSLVQKKTTEIVHPEIGFMYFNAPEKAKHSPNGDSHPENGGTMKPPSLLVNLVEEGNRIIENLSVLGQAPHPCVSTVAAGQIEPINLYHKVGHGSLDMYILNPPKDSKEMKDFYQQWNKHVNHFAVQKSGMPLPNMLSICALLVWRPSAKADKITRLLFPGDAPQNRIFEGLDKLKNLNILQHPQCCDLDLSGKAKKVTVGKPARAPVTKSAPAKRPSPDIKPEPKQNGTKPIGRSATKPPQKIAKDDHNKKKEPGKEKKDKSKSPASTPSSSSKSPVKEVPDLVQVKKEVVTPVAEPVPVAEIKQEVATPNPEDSLMPVNDMSPIEPVKLVDAPAESTPLEVNKAPTPPIDDVSEPLLNIANKDPSPEPEPAREPTPEPPKEPSPPPKAPSPEPLIETTPTLPPVEGLLDFSQPSQQETTSDEQPIDAAESNKAPEVESAPQTSNEFPAETAKSDPVHIDSPEPLPDPIEYPPVSQQEEVPLLEPTKDLVEDPEKDVDTTELEDSLEPKPPGASIMTDSLEPQEQDDEPVMEGIKSVCEEPVKLMEGVPVEACYQETREKTYEEMGIYDDDAVGTQPTIETSPKEPEVEKIQEQAPAQTLEDLGIYDNDAEDEPVREASPKEPEIAEEAESQEQALESPEQPPAQTLEDLGIYDKEPEIAQEAETQKQAMETPEQPTAQTLEDLGIYEKEPETQEQALEAPEKIPAQTLEDLGVYDKDPEIAQEAETQEQAMEAAEKAPAQTLEDLGVYDDESPAVSSEHEPPSEESGVYDNEADLAVAGQVLNQLVDVASDVPANEGQLQEEPLQSNPEPQQPDFDSKSSDKKALEDLGIYDDDADVKPQADVEPIVEREASPASEPHSPDEDLTLDEPEHDDQLAFERDSIEKEVIKRNPAPPTSQSMEVNGSSGSTSPDGAPLLDLGAPTAPQPDVIQPPTGNLLDNWGEPQGLPPANLSVSDDSSPYSDSDSPPLTEQDITPDQPNNPFDVIKDGDVSEQMPSTNPFVGLEEKVLQPDVVPQCSSNPFDDIPTGGSFPQHNGAQNVDDNSFDPLKEWGEPMNLPAPTPGANTTKKSSAPKKADPKKPAGSAKAADATKKPIKKEPGTEPKTKPGRRSEPVAARKPAVPTALKKGRASTPGNDVPTPAATKRAATAKPAATSASKPTPSKAASKRPATAPAKSAPAKSPSLAPVTPVYIDLAYVPSHGNPNHTDLDFFRRVRARHYVISSLEPSTKTMAAILDAKATWENKELEVTIIPTYDNDALRHWMSLEKDRLSELKVDLAPSASRCTIQLQDHETSCAAYRLEF